MTASARFDVTIWPSRHCRTRHETCLGSGVSSVESLRVWQLADDLRRCVHALAERPVVRRDFRFVSQLEDAASGVTRNIAEGYGRRRPREFARFLLIARGSLFELQDHLTDGTVRAHWTEPELRDTRILCRRTCGAVDGLIRYLYSPQASRAADASIRVKR